METPAQPNIEQKVVEILDAAQQGAVKVGETIIQYSPDVANAFLAIVRIEGLAKLIPSILILVACCVFYRSFIRMWKWALSRYHYSIDRHLFACIASAIICVFVIHALFCILNIWNWVAIFEPKLWLAKQLVDKLI